MTAERFQPDLLVEQACELAGSDDFGDDDTWRDGLARLSEGLVSEARLNDLGVEIAVLDIIRPLTSRLQIVKWRKENPDIAAQPVTRPIFIVGQPRTGTTILFDLLAQDPALRPPLTWEVDNPFPLPRPETYDTDPRIAETQAIIEMSEQIVPGLLAFHPMGALVGQECVRITAGQFCSMIFSVQYRLPSYYRWLLYEADHHPAYRYHRMFLQHLQSGVAGQWLLKSPAHLWQLDALVAEYPDALIVQTHRDPLNVISSISALTHHLRHLASDESSISRMRGPVLRGDRRRSRPRYEAARLAGTARNRRAVRRLHPRPILDDPGAVCRTRPRTGARCRAEHARVLGGPSW